jgi:hypothetical protein
VKNKEQEMKVVYTSPALSNRKFLVPEIAVKTYQRRDAALLKLQQLGGLAAPFTPEVAKLRQTMLEARRKIEREGWHCVSL